MLFALWGSLFASSSSNRFSRVEFYGTRVETTTAGLAEVVKSVF